MKAQTVCVLGGPVNTDCATLNNYASNDCPKGCFTVIISHYTHYSRIPSIQTV